MDSRVWRHDRAGEAGSGAPDPVAPVWPVLAELEIYTPTRRLLGWIAPEGERASDWMNRGEEVELLASLEVGLAADRPELPDPQRDARRVRLASQDVLFAVPPSLPQGRHLRLHRRIARIEFEMGEYDVSGHIHVRPGTEPMDGLLRSPRVFVPITDAQLIHHEEPRFSRAVQVLVVNSRHVTRLQLNGSSPARRSPSQVTAKEWPDESTPATALDQDLGAIEPLAGSVHRALSELTALHRDGLIDDAEFQAKRSEILARL
jgi:hypothetical protein